MLSKSHPLSFNFTFGKGKNHRGCEVQWEGRVGDDCRIRRNQKLPHNKRCVSWNIVMTHGSGVVAPLVWTFAPDVFPQSSENIAIEFSIHCLPWIAHLQSFRIASHTLATFLVMVPVKGRPERSSSSTDICPFLKHWNHSQVCVWPRASSPNA
jgi:hypothetical protein